ncbi:MAG: amidohydrolase family protein, partial [Planctomycetota bacterium]
HDADALRFLLGVVGDDRVVLGSDYPFPLGEHLPGALIDSMDDLGADRRARLLGGNALDWLGAAAETFAPARPAAETDAGR